MASILGLFSKRKTQVKPSAPQAPALQEKKSTMDILIRNIRTDQNTLFYEVESVLANALIAAGLAQKYVKPAAQPLERKWKVGHPPANPNAVVLVCADTFGGVMYFSGKPDDYLKIPPVHCGSVCPKEVLEEYKATCTPKDPAVVMEEIHQRQNAQIIQRQKEAAATARLVG